MARPDIIGLSGGAKRLYLVTHKEEVLKFYAEHGLYQTLIEFNLGFDTLQTFLRENVKYTDSPRTQPDKDNFKLRLSMAESAIREVASKQRKLIDDFGKFVPGVADTLAKKYIIPGIINGLAQTIIDESPTLPENDPLKLKNEAESRKLYVMSGDEEEDN